jgi:hypothetical protein
MVGWAVETSLDVEYAHAMAPGAKILLVETPVAETEGIVGFPEIVEAERSERDDVGICQCPPFRIVVTAQRRRRRPTRGGEQTVPRADSDSRSEEERYAAARSVS